MCVWNPSYQSLIRVHQILCTEKSLLDFALPNSKSHSISSSWLIVAITPIKVLTFFKIIYSPSLPLPLILLLRTPYLIRSYHSRNLSPLSAKSASLAKSFIILSLFHPPVECPRVPSDLKESFSLSPSSQKNLLLSVLTLTQTITTYITIMHSCTCAIECSICNQKKNSRVSCLSTREVLIAPARPISASWRSCNNQQCEINNHFVDSTGGNILSYSQSSFSNNSYKKQWAKLIYCLHEHNTKNVVIVVFDCPPPNQPIPHTTPTSFSQLLIYITSMKYSQGLSSACWKLWRLADMSSGTPSPPEFGIVAPLRLRTLLRSPCGIRRCCWDTLVKSLADERLVECFMRCRETPLLLFPLPAWSCGCWWVEEWLLTLLSADEPDSWPVSGPLRRWSEENSNTKGDIMYNHNGLKHIGRTKKLTMQLPLPKLIFKNSTNSLVILPHGLTDLVSETLTFECRLMEHHDCYPMA